MWLRKREGSIRAFVESTVSHLVPEDEVADELPAEPRGVLDDAVGEELACVHQGLGGGEADVLLRLALGPALGSKGDDLAPERPVADQVVVLRSQEAGKERPSLGCRGLLEAEEEVQEKAEGKSRKGRRARQRSRKEREEEATDEEMGGWRVGRRRRSESRAAEGGGAPLLVRTGQGKARQG